jgi:hypothetical protein
MISGKSKGPIKEIARLAIDYVKKGASSCELNFTVDPQNNFIQFNLECPTEEALRHTDEMLMSKIIEECEKRGFDHVIYK